MSQEGKTIPTLIAGIGGGTCGCCVSEERGEDPIIRLIVQRSGDSKEISLTPMAALELGKMLVQDSEPYVKRLPIKGIPLTDD